MVQITDARMQTRSLYMASMLLLREPTIDWRNAYRREIASRIRRLDDALTVFEHSLPPAVETIVHDDLLPLITTYQEALDAVRQMPDYRLKYNQILVESMLRQAAAISDQFNEIVDVYLHINSTQMTQVERIALVVLALFFLLLLIEALFIFRPMARQIGAEQRALVMQIAQREQIEAELRHERNLLDSIIKTSVAAIVVLDDQGSIVFANNHAEDVLGLASSEVVGRAYDAPEWKATDFEGNPFPVEQMPFALVKATGQPVFNIRHAIEWSDGRRRYLSINGAPLDGQNGMRGVVTAFTDMTDYILTERKMRSMMAEQQRSKLLSDFLRSTSHDLRTPITVLSTGLYLLGKADDPAKRQTKIEALQNTLHELTHLIEQMQNMAVLDSLTSLPLLPGDLNRVAESVFASAQNRASHQNIRFMLELDETLPHLPLHIERLSLAMTQLIDNALRYASTATLIKLRTYQSGDAAFIDICNDGLPINPDELPYIFDRFYKVDQARTSNGSGAGLGLAMVRRILELHHGSVCALSDRHGTIFRLMLPLTMLVREPR
jgi:PAS domain S-box-containing protein